MNSKPQKDEGQNPMDLIIIYLGLERDPTTCGMIFG